MLRYLVEHPGRLVTQDEILEALWPETYVNPEIIKKYILEIRKVLGDRHDKPEFIETFPKRGYQFVAAVSDESAASSPSFSIKGIVGRKTALAELGACLASALRSQRQLVFVTGEAGIGKTTLVDAFHQQASFQPNLRIARGQCVEGFGGKEAYYPILEALAQLVRDSDGSRVAQTLAEAKLLRQILAELQKLNANLAPKKSKSRRGNARTQAHPDSGQGTAGQPRSPSAW